MIRWLDKPRVYSEYIVNGFGALHRGLALLVFEEHSKAGKGTHERFLNGFLYSVRTV